MRIQRKNLCGAVAFGLGTMAGPPVIAIAILVFGPGGCWSIGFAVVFFLLALVIIPGVLQFVSVLEQEGNRVRFLRLWTRRWQEKTAEELVGMTTRAAPDSDVPGFRVYAFHLWFRDGASLYLNIDDFPGSEVMIETLTHAAPPSFTFPLSFGMMRLTNVIVHVEEPTAGRSVTYLGPDLLFLSVHVYDAGMTSVPDGLSAELTREFEDAKQQVLGFAPMAQPGAKVEHLSDAAVRLGTSTNSVEAMRALFKTRIDALEREERLYMAASRGHFIKMRVTDPEPGKTDDRLSIVDCAYAAMTRQPTII